MSGLTLPTIRREQRPARDGFDFGVWWAGYLVGGKAVLTAVDRHGNRIAEMVVEDEATAEEAGEALWAMLRAMSPEPTSTRLH